MKKRIAGVFLLAVSMLGAETVIEMEPINVTAQYEATGVRESHKSMTVITSEEIVRNGASNLADALKLIPEIDIRDWTGTGKTTTIDIRGQGETAASNILVTIDGAPISPVDISGNDLNTIPVEKIDRIEVRYGAGGVLYGDRAVGGVVNIITKKESDRGLIGSFKVESGSFKTGKIAGDVTINSKKYTFGIQMIKNTTDGYRNHSKAEGTYMGMLYGLKLDSNSTLMFSAGERDDKIQMPGALYSDEMKNDRSQALYNHYNPDYSVTRKTETKAESDTNEKNYVLTYRYSGKNGALYNVLSYNDKKVDSVSSPAWEWSSESTLVRNNLKIDHKLWFNNITAGVDYQSGRTKSGTDMIMKETLGSYWYDKINMFGDRLTLNFGSRSEEIKMYFADSVEKEFDKILREYGVSYKYSNFGNVFAGYGEGYRVPATDECFEFDPITYAKKISSTIKPQMNNTIQMGIKDGNSYFTVKGVVYIDKAKDEIYYNPYTGANTNMVGENERKGLELSAEQYIGESIVLSQYVNFKETEITEGDFKGKSIPGVENRKAGGSITWSYTEKGRVAVKAEYMGDRYPISDFKNKTKKEGAYTKVDLNISHKIGMGDLVFGLSNILNEKYYECFVLDYMGKTAYYPAPGRGVKAGYTFSF